MRHHIQFLAIGLFLTSCIPEWEPIIPADTIYHRNDTLSFYLIISVNQSDQQFIDTLSVVGWTFDVSLSAHPTRGQGTVYVLDQRDSILLAWDFVDSDYRKKSFNQMPYRTILSLRRYTGSLSLAVHGRKL